MRGRFVTWGERPWSQDELDLAADLWCRNPVHGEGFFKTGAELRAYYYDHPASVASRERAGAAVVAAPPPAATVDAPAATAAVWDQEREQGVLYTARTCSRCGRRYVWPKGSRRPGACCPVCSPELDGVRP